MTLTRRLGFGQCRRQVGKAGGSPIQDRVEVNTNEPRLPVDLHDADLMTLEVEQAKLLNL